MEIFVSWSGDQSKAIAELLRDWLPKVIQHFKPWISSSDIEKGTRWFPNISEKLESTNFGIFCLTQENFNNPWILYEAGAISKSIDDSRVWAILFGFGSTELVGPFQHFQQTKPIKADMLKLLQNMNTLLDDKALSDYHLDESFRKWWPSFERKLKKIENTPINKIPKRNDREMLEEVLMTVRFIAENNDIYKETNFVLARLTPREEKVIRMKSGLGERKKFVLSEIAEYFNSTEEDINEIATEALTKLREPAYYKIYNYILNKIIGPEI